MIRPGTAENTGCDDSSVDAIISVNNVMLWNQTKAFAELHRVLRPDGHLIVAEHQHGHPDRAHFLRRRAEAAGFSLNRLVVENDTTIHWLRLVHVEYQVTGLNGDLRKDRLAQPPSPPGEPPGIDRFPCRTENAIPGGQD